MDEQAPDLDSMADALRRLRDYILFTQFDTHRAGDAVNKLKLAGIEAGSEPVFVDLVRYLGFDKNAFEDVLTSQIKSKPWQIAWFGYDGLDPGRTLVAFLEPDLKSRRRLEMKGDLEPSSVLDIPVLLLNAKIDKVASSQLKTIVQTVSLATKTDFLPEGIKACNALSFLLAQFLYATEAFNDCFGIPYVRDMACVPSAVPDDPVGELLNYPTISAVQESPKAIRRLAVLKANEQTPAFLFDDILQFWQRNSHELLTTSLINLTDSRELVLWDTLPPKKVAYATWSELMERNELQVAAPKIEIDLESWNEFSSARAALRGGFAHAMSRESVFYRVGNMWYVKFEGEDGVFPDLNGMRYISQLLQAPNSRIGSMELLNRDTDSGDVFAGDLREIGCTTGSQVSLEATDQKAVAEVNREIKKLEKQLSSDVLPEKERRAKERALQQCRAYLGQTVGKSGRPRKVSNDRERSRKSVFLAIDACIQKLRVSMPQTAEHFKSSIRTGSFCSYRPPAPVNWHTQ